MNKFNAYKFVAYNTFLDATVRRVQLLDKITNIDPQTPPFDFNFRTACPPKAMTACGVPR